MIYKEAIQQSSWSSWASILVSWSDLPSNISRIDESFLHSDIMAKTENQIVVNSERGATTINVRELLTLPWYKYPHLRKLYLWLSVVLFVQATNGMTNYVFGVQIPGARGSNNWLP